MVCLSLIILFHVLNSALNLEGTIYFSNKLNTFLSSYINAGCKDEKKKLMGIKSFRFKH